MLVKKTCNFFEHSEIFTIYQENFKFVLCFTANIAGVTHFRLTLFLLK